MQPKRCPTRPSSAKIISSSDSGSSDEDGLVDPNKIDLNSTFFTTKPIVQQEASEAPNFDCNAGMNLSDSSDNEDNDEKNENNYSADVDDSGEKKKTSSIINDINKQSSSEVHDFSHLQQFNKNLESAKEQLTKLKEKEASTSKAADESDITKLLSLGEGTNSSHTTLSQSNRKHKSSQRNAQNSDDSDWENVSGKRRKITNYFNVIPSK